MRWANGYGDIPAWYHGPAFHRTRPRRRGIGAMVLAAVLALAGCSGCQHTPPPTPSSPTNVTDGALPPYAPPDGPATCLDRCRNGQHLGCSWANDTANGATCVDVCLNHQSSGIAPWDLDCDARETSCPRIDACQ